MQSGTSWCCLNELLGPSALFRLVIKYIVISKGFVWLFIVEAGCPVHVLNGVLIEMSVLFFSHILGFSVGLLQRNRNIN